MDAKARPTRGIHRIATARERQGGLALVVEVGDRRTLLQHGTAALLSADAIRGNLEQECRSAGTEMAVFVHRNRDGSLAIATGELPEIWPEDERPTEKPTPPDSLSVEE